MSQSYKGDKRVKDISYKGKYNIKSLKVIRVIIGDYQSYEVERRVNIVSQSYKGECRV